MGVVSDGAASDRSAQVTFGGQEFELLPERALWWRARETVLVADLHWGKSAAWRSAGAPVPGGVAAEQLDRLSLILGGTGAKRLVVLGDLLHAKSGMTDRLLEQVAAWRARWGRVAVEVVPGNHDVGLELVADMWGIRMLADSVVEDGIELRHAPGSGARGAEIAGHEHPAVWVGGGAGRTKAACFRVGKRRLILPAFSRFTAGGSFQEEAGERVFVCAEDRVIELARQLR